MGYRNFETFKLGVDYIWFDKHTFITFEEFIILFILLIQKLWKLEENFAT